MRKQTQVDRRYLKALEVLALEEMEGGQGQANLNKAREIVSQENLNKAEEL